MQPLVSIVIPVFNRQDGIIDCLRSLQTQCYTSWEAIVVDDCSMDESAAAIKKVSAGDERIRYFLNDRATKGGNTCRNIGVALSTGDLLLFLDSDDLLKPGCLTQRVQLLVEEPSMDFVVFPGEVFKSDRSSKNVYWNAHNGETALKRFLLFDSPWQTSGPLWRKRFLLEKAIRWDEQLFIWQDVDFHMQALLHNPVYEIMWAEQPDYLVKADSVNSVSRSQYNAPEKAASRFYFFEKCMVALQDNSFINPGWLRSLLLQILKQSVFQKKWKRVAAVLTTAADHQIIQKKERQFLSRHILLSRLSFNRIVFPSLKTTRLVNNYNKLLQKIPVE